MNHDHTSLKWIPRQFGVEQEHFVFHDDGTVPSHEEIDQLWSGLCRSEFQIQAMNSQGRVLSVVKQTARGDLVITNDSCTHIVEVAFPPHRSLTEFGRQFRDTWGLVTDLLRGIGLAIRTGGSVTTPPEVVNWRPKNTDPDGLWLHTLINREALDSPLFHQYFPGCFAATHVSLGICEETAINYLPAYYAFEFLVPLWFSTSKQFRSVRTHCVRPLAWQANFHQPYPMLGIPSPIPRDLNEYSQCLSAGMLRDYSFVAIRNKERLEFRSACSQVSEKSVEQLIRCRLAIDAAVQDGMTGDWCPCTSFEDACLGRAVVALPKALELLGPYLSRFGFSHHSFYREAGSITNNGYVRTTSLL